MDRLPYIIAYGVSYQLLTVAVARKVKEGYIPQGGMTMEIRNESYLQPMVHKSLLKDIHGQD